MKENLLILCSIEGELIPFHVFFNHFVWMISDAQLKAVCEAYGHYSKKDIEDAIKAETSGSLCRSLLAIGKCRR